MWNAILNFMKNFKASEGINGPLEGRHSARKQAKALRNEEVPAARRELRTGAPERPEQFTETANISKTVQEKAKKTKKQGAKSAIRKKAHNIALGKKMQSQNRVVAWLMALIIVFCTVVNLTSPAMALADETKVLNCTCKPHVHDESCYVDSPILDAQGNQIGTQKVLACAKADYVVHTHDESCYDKNGNLICPLPEIPEHKHTKDCYVEQDVLSCGKEESLGHTHTDECYENVRGDLTCGKEEHTHTDACYDENGQLTCDKEEHTHDDSCYKWEKKVICGQKESKGHTHTAECYKKEKVLICNQPTLHTHSKKCYDKKGNLICGKIELKKHTHDKECFQTIPANSQEEITAVGVETDKAQVNTTNNTTADTQTPDTAAPAEQQKQEVGTPDQQQTDGQDATVDQNKEGSDKSSKEEIKQKEEGTTAQQEQTKQDNMPAQTFNVNGSNFTVYAEAEDGTFPAGTRMTIKPVKDQDVKAAVSEVVDGQIKKMQAVDIAFYTKDENGADKEIEPLKPIKVKITSDVISEAKKDDNAKNGEAMIVHVSDEGNAEVIQQADTLGFNDVPAENQVIFNADEFSVYAIIYTVDFEYTINGTTYEYSIEGDSSISLKKLLPILGVIDKKDANDFVENAIEKVTFSNPELVEVIHKTPFLGFIGENDWLLKSLKPFNTEESLVITLKDGQTITIKVTDDQESTNLADFLTDAKITIDGRTYGKNETWPVRPNVDYEMTFHFAEAGLNQFPMNREEMTLAIPDGLSLKAGTSGTFDMPFGMAGTLKNNQWWVDNDGKLQVKFADDPTGLLRRSSTAYMDIILFAKFDGSQHDFSFNDKVNIHTEDDNSADVKIHKSGQFNESDGKMHYTITLESTGNPKNIKVTDSFGSSNLLTLDPNSITLNPSSTSLDGGINTSNSGFNLTIAQMQHNETVTIQYTASVNMANVPADGTISQENGKNTVNVESPNIPEKPPVENVIHKIKYSDISKTSTGSEDKGNTVELTWTAVINSKLQRSLAGTPITDEIDGSSKDIMTYLKDSDGKVELTIKKTDANGNTTTQTVKVPVTPKYNGGPETWTYNVPENEGIYKYEITYKTVAVKQTNSATVKNKIHTGGSDESIGSGVVPGTTPEDNLTAAKTAVNVTAEYTDWNIVIDVPAEGFPDGLTVYENVPYFGNMGYADTFEKILDITGLEPTEGYSYETLHTDLEPAEDGSVGGNNIIWNLRNKGITRDVVKIDFKKSDGQPGLDSKARTVTIKLRTNNNEDWMKYAEPRGGGDEAYYHRNNAFINGTRRTGSSIPLNTSIKKELEETGKTTDGLPIYSYKITFTNVKEEPLVITDTFDTDDLCLYGDGLGDPSKNRDKIAGAEQKHNLNGGTDPAYKINITPTDDGITITADSLPKKQDGSFYEYYQIYYRLQIKDQSALNRIKQQALLNNGVYQIKNTAEWNENEDDVSVDFEFPPLVKEGKFDPDNNRVYKFKIDVNPDAVTMNNGEIMDLIDTHSDNLSVDYSTIKIYELEAGESKEDSHLTKDKIVNNIVWNFDANSGTFKIPDGHHYVITYNALIIGSGTQEFYNEATMNGFYSTKNDKATYGGSADAGGEILQINLLKYEQGQTSKGLEGCTFQLFKGTGTYDPVTGDEIKEPMKYGAGNHVGENITFTTKEAGTDEYGQEYPDGSVIIALNQTDDGNQLELGTHYYLKEVDAAPGYQIDSSVEYWEFTLTTDPDEVNYGDPDRRDERGWRQWIYYYYGDILKVSNTPTDQPLKIDVDKKWFNEQGEEITEPTLKANLVAKAQLLRKTNDGEYVKVKAEVDATGKVTNVTEVTDNSGEVNLDQSNNWSYTWKDLPRDLKNGTKYAYKVEEISVDGYISDVEESEDDNIKHYSFENYKIPEDKNTNIEVEKNWQNSDGTPLDVATVENLPDKIEFYLYQVPSTTPFKVTPSSGGIKYVINNDSRLVNPNAGENDDEYGLYKITKTSDWRTVFEGLPEVRTENGKTLYYDYYVKEVPLTGYTTSYIYEGKLRRIINRLPRPEGEYINIGLQKNWINGDNTDPPQGATSTFKVHQLKSTKTGGASGDIIVELYSGKTGDPITTTKANIGDIVSFSGKTTAYNWTAISVYRFHENSGPSWDTVSNIQGGADGSFTTSGHEITESDITDGNKFKMSIDNTNFVEACTEGPTWDSGQISYSDFVETDYTRTVTLPTSAGAWTTTIKDLIKEDEEGNRYKYYIVEESCTPEASTVTFKDDTGKDIAHAIDTDKQKVEVTNQYTNQNGSLTLKKTSDYAGSDANTKVYKIAVKNAVGDYMNQSGGTTSVAPVWVEFKANEEKTWSDLPEGNYTVVEDEASASVPGKAWAWTVTGENGVTVNDKTITVPAGSEETKATVANSYTDQESVDISAKKEWIDTPDTSQATAVEFTLYSQAADGTLTKVKKDVENTDIENPQVIIKNEGWTGKAEWENLPKYEGNPQVAINYVVKETGVYYGSLTADDPDTTVDESGNIPENAVFAKPDAFEVAGEDPININADNIGEATITNKPITVNVPVVKTWDNTVEEGFTWSATLKLEKLEVLYRNENGEVVYDAQEAHDSASHAGNEVWTPVTPVVIRTITNETGNDPLFTDLPKFRTADDGKVYIIMYAVDEIGYEVKNANGQRIAYKDESSIEGDIEYTPEYNDDADDITNYTVSLKNTEKNETEGNKIDLTIHKNWPEGTNYANDSSSYATFRLMRTWHTEQKNLADSHIDKSKPKVTIKVANAAGITVAQLDDVYVGTPFRLQAGFKAKDAGNGAVIFRRSDNNQEYRINHNWTEHMSLGAGAVIYAPEGGLTLTYQSGENFLVDGLPGIVISDRVYGAATADQPDTRPTMEYPTGFNNDPSNIFTLNKLNDWKRTFEKLPQTVVDTSGDIETTTVYGYYFEEIKSKPAGFGAKYYLGDHEINSENKVFFTGTVEARNEQLTEFKVFKTWWNAEDKDMPGIVYELYRQNRDSGGNPQGEPVLQGTFMLDQTGGYQLNTDTHLIEDNDQLSDTAWTNPHYVDTGSDAPKYFYMVKELGIYVPAASGSNAGKWSVAETSSDRLKVEYKADPGKDGDNNWKNDWTQPKLDPWRNPSGNLQLTIRNTPKPYTNQIHLIKRWRDFTSSGGVSDTRIPNYEIKIQLVRRIHRLDNGEEVEKKVYGEPITLIHEGGSYNAWTGQGTAGTFRAINNGNAWGEWITDGNGEWHYLQHNTEEESLPLYGYYYDSEGNAFACQYEYTFAELSAKCDFDYDGVYETNWLERVLYDGSSQQHEDNTVYLMDNFRTSKIILRKKWYGTVKADYVLFSLVDDTGLDWGELIHDYIQTGGRDYSFFGITEKNLKKHNGKWYIAVYPDQLDADGNWTLTLEGIPYLWINQNEDGCHEQEYDVTEAFIHDEDGYHAITSEDNVLYTSWYRGTLKSDPQLSTGHAHVQMGRDDENEHEETTTTVIVSNITDTELKIDKEWFNKDGEKVTPSEDNPITIEIEGKTYTIDKLQYVLKVTVSNADGSNDPTSQGYTRTGYYTGSTGGDGQLTLSASITGAKTYDVTEGENHDWSKLIRGLPSGAIFERGTGVQGKRYYVESYDYEVQEFKVIASGNGENNKDVTAYFRKASQRTQENANEMAEWKISNTEIDKIPASVKVTKIFSGINALPEGFKITASWEGHDPIELKATGTQPENVTLTGTGSANDPYVWEIKDLEEGTEVTFTESGYTKDGCEVTVKANAVAGTFTATAIAAPDPDIVDTAKASFENIYHKKIEITKKWLGSDGNTLIWPKDDDDKDLEITVNVTRWIHYAQTHTNEDRGFKLIYKLTSDIDATGIVPEDGSILPSGVAASDYKLKLKSSTDNAYTFELTGLPAEGSLEGHTGTWIYRFKEDTENLPESYHFLRYTDQDGSAYDTGAADQDKVLEGGVIENEEVSYALPHTGGIGTDLFRTLGLLLIAFAVMGYGYKLAMRKRLVLRTGKDPRGGDSRR